MSENIKIRVRLDRHHAKATFPKIKPIRPINIQQPSVRWKSTTLVVSLCGLLSVGYWGLDQFTGQLASAIIQAPALVVPSVDGVRVPAAQIGEAEKIEQVSTGLPTRDDLGFVEIEQVKKITGPTLLRSDPANVLQPLDETSVAQRAALPKTSLAALAEVQLKNLAKSNRYVARAQLTRAIQGREPMDKLSDVLYTDQNITRLYYFTELQHLRGQRITHQWEYQGKVMARIPFRIGSNRWRTYSSKRLNKSMLGNWQVVVTDEHGRVLHTQKFEYLASPRAVSLR